jgi:rhodanese-related sulfurtransferase
MRWGMSSWNMQFARQAWLKGISGKYENILDTVTHLKPEPAGMPVLSTGYPTGREISDARFAKVFSDGTSNLLVTADEVFSNPGKYYVINLERKDKYEGGHIPGAVRYKPDATLGILEEMSTIPFDRTVVVYCGTGHNSAFATAYLRLFGYDARTLRYGNSSFMYGTMIKQKAALSWIPFTEADINDFSFVK